MNARPPHSCQTKKMCDRKEELKVKLLDGPCAEQYLALERCLTSTDRDWVKCKDMLGNFRRCQKEHSDNPNEVLIVPRPKRRRRADE